MRFSVSICSFSNIALVAALSAYPAQAEVSHVGFEFDMPAQDMATALNALARKTKNQIIFKGGAVLGKRSNALRGRHTVDEAIDILIDGSGLVVSKSARGIYVVHSQSNLSASDAEHDAMGQASPEAEAIIVTGSRIRRPDKRTSQPVTMLSEDSVSAQGYNNVAYVLNDLPIAGLQESGRGDQGANVGRNYANLLNLGSARTLTLVNGRRFVSSNPAMPDTRSPGNQVDLNTIPAGLIERVEIIPATGAATYGSGAIAGVVNIILKDDFDGIQLSGQTGITSRSDRATYSGRITVGQDFADHRGHFVVSGEYTKQRGLYVTDRPSLARGYTFAPNVQDTGPTDGIPASILISDWRLPELTYGGLPFMDDTPFVSSIVTVADPSAPGGRVPVQFASDGTLVPYDIGTYYDFALASGGQGLPLAATFALETPIERKLLYALGRYELSDGWTLSTELSGSWVRAREQRDQGSAFNSALTGGVGGVFGPLLMDITNPFLSDQARTVLTSQGLSQFYLNRYSDDLLANGGGALVKTKTQRAAVALDGEFSIGDKNLYVNTNVNWGHTGESFVGRDILQQNFLYAIDAVLVGDTITCRVKADNPGSTDPAIAGCQPLNLFGNGAPSRAATDYVIGEFRRQADISLFDAQFNLGGELAKLPAGMLRFSSGVEYRREKSEYEPGENTRLGTGRLAQEVAIAGSYHATEVYGELLVPLVGEDFRLPLIYSLDIDGAGRYVDNSIAGSDASWNAGARWRIIPDIMIRGSKSRTFRAPSALELFQPNAQGVSGRVTDPCDYRNIGGGNNPAARTENCRSLFQSLGLPADYQLTSLAQTISVPVTVGGNTGLKNEIANSTTLGVVLEPRFIPNLSISADWVKIHLKDGITNFRINSILSTCFDAPDPSDSICGLVTRDADAQITFAKTGYVNAAYTDFESLNFSVQYRTALAGGSLQLGLDAVNVRKLATSVSGLGYDLDVSAGEVAAPKWKGQLRLVYSRGPLSLFWTSQYVGPVRYNVLLAPEDQDILGLPSYTKHDASISYNIGEHYNLRVGVNNLFDRLPPYPAGANGADFGAYDVVGRNFFASFNLTF